MSKVFISYAHSSHEHKRTVPNLAVTLRGHGLTVLVDTDVTTPQGPEEGWPRWMKHQIKDADWVLMFFDEQYRKRFDGDEEPGIGLGATWEGAIITHRFYRESARNKKFIPILTDGSSANLIPDELFGYTRYYIPKQTEELAVALDQSAAGERQDGSLKGPEVFGPETQRGSTRMAKLYLSGPLAFVPLGFFLYWVMRHNNDHPNAFVPKNDPQAPLATGPSNTIGAESQSSPINSPGSINLNNSPGTIINSPNSTAIVAVQKPPRREITTDQRATILSALTNLPNWQTIRLAGQVAVLTHEPDAETKSFAMQISHMLQQAQVNGRDIMQANTFNIPEAPRGINFFIADPKTAPPYSETLLKAFITAGISATGYVALPFGMERRTNILVIYVGPQ